MALTETKVDEKFIEEMNQYRKTEEGKGLLEQCSKSVVIFAEKMLGIRLYAWEVDFLHRLNLAADGNYWTREFLAVTSRQIGKSMSLDIFNLWAAVFNKVPGTIHYHTIIGMVSASDDQAKKHLREINKLIRSGDKYMERTYKANGKSVYGEKFFSNLLDDKEPNNTTTISFKPYKADIHGDYLLKGSLVGSVIKSYPPTSAVLSETFTIVEEDEAGLTERMTDQFHDEYLYPTGNANNAIRIYTSTPWVSSGFFYRLADPMDDFPEHSVDRLMFSIDAIKLEAPKYYESVLKHIAEMNRDGKTDEVQRAYYCRFIKGEKSYFNQEKVSSIFLPDYYKMESFKEPCDLGVDFGAQHISKTVLTISRLNDKGKIERVYDKVYEVGQDLALLDDIAELMKVFNIQRIIPDDCPAGSFMIAQMIEKGWNVHPMNFRAEKVKKYGAFRAALNRGEVISYPDDRLRTEMLALEFTDSKVQSVIMHAPGYTDDIIDSFVMSSYFFLEEEEGFNYYDVDDYEDTEEYSDESGYFEAKI